MWSRVFWAQTSASFRNDDEWGTRGEEQALRKKSCDYGTLSKEELCGDLPKERLTEKRLSWWGERRPTLKESLEAECWTQDRMLKSLTHSGSAVTGSWAKLWLKKELRDKLQLTGQVGRSLLKEIKESGLFEVEFCGLCLTKSHFVRLCKVSWL